MSHSLVHREAASFVQSVAAAFDRAVAAAGGVVDRDFLIAGQPVRLRFAGAGLIPYLTPAFAHLAQAHPAEPAFAIHLWESTTTSVEPPPPAWPYEDFQSHGVVQPFGTQDVQAIFQLGTNTLNVLDAPRGRGFYWVRSAHLLPMYEQGAPLRWLLHLWLRRLGILSVHAGAVGAAEGGVLLVGRGGSGKSNTALATMASDLLYAADDYCLVQSDPQPAIHSLYGTGKAHAADLAHLPFLAGRASNPEQFDHEKALFFLHQHFPHKFLRSAPARAVLMPRVTGRRRTQAHLTTAAAGMAALAPSTIAQLPGVQAEDFRVLVKFFRQVPSYILELSADREEVMSVMARLITELNLGRRPSRWPG